jgi:hypothetical protein
MFYFIAPLFGIIFLIGIFQIISLHKSLFNLLKCSMKDYYFCQIKHDCILNEIKEKPEYNFYKYFYDSSNNETIDFKLTMITAIFGEMLLKSRGFRISSFVLGLINIGCMFWLYNFDTSFKESDFEYFSIIKVVNILAFYLLLLIGIGSSALLSQKILIDSHLKYKEYNIKRIRENLKKDKNKKLKEEEHIDKEMISINDEQKESLNKNKKNKNERQKKSRRKIKKKRKK